MVKMEQDQQLDANMFELFLRTDLARKYVASFLLVEQVDEYRTKDFFPDAAIQSDQANNDRP